MESFVKDIRRDIKKTFNNDDFEKEKQIIKNGHIEILNQPKSDALYSVKFK